MTVAEVRIEPVPVDAVRLVYDLGRALFNVVLSPAAERPGLAARMMSPRPGDLVIALMVGFDPNGVGRLVSSEGEIFTGTRVRPLHTPAEVARWSRTEFVALPEGRVSEWIGQ
jgi:hypothetical protein